MNCGPPWFFPDAMAPRLCLLFHHHEKHSVNFAAMKRPVRVSPLPGDRISIVFSDGLEGVIDISSSIGRRVFAPLADLQVFAGVHLGDHGQIAWSEEMEICPGAAYLEAFGQRSHEPAHA